MNRQFRRVLVTGGFGFIGSHIAKDLVSRGYEVGVFDSLITGEKTNLSGKFEKHIGDIRDHHLVEQVVGGYDAVIHEAAMISVPRSFEDPLTFSSVNTEGTLNLLKAAAKFKLRKFVFASSAAVYGDGGALPTTENARPQPMSPYAVSKLAAEHYCTTFAKVHGLPSVVLRYFNVYGPGQGNGQYSGVIPTFIRAAERGEPLVIFGSGKQKRDFVYVDDVVQANVAALERDVRDGIFNIATGTPVTINQLARLVLRYEGRTAKGLTHAPPRAGDIMNSCADIGKARKILGYAPKVSIEAGLGRVIEWMRKGPEGQGKKLKGKS